uniref:Protein kinase domain-containing protein n=1 Tax=viral metagenome TaxID=1070528 RepID=A0A6C0DRY9_9ZZZZ
MDEKFKHSYFKSIPIDLKHLEENFIQTEDDIKYGYNAFRIHDFQNYIPIYSTLFNMNEKNYNQVTLNNQYHFMNMNTVYDSINKTTCNKPVFIKFSPLIDPIRFMIGKYNSYDSIRRLPTINNSEECFAKLVNYNNVSYVDGFYCFLTNILLEKHGFIHGLQYYGSYLGVQDVYKANVTDDIDYLKSSDYFNENINNGFSITDMPKNEYGNFGSRGNKNKLQISETNHNITIDNVDTFTETNNDTITDNSTDIKSTQPTIELESIYETEKNKDGTNKSESNGYSSTNTSNNSEANYSTDEESDTESTNDNEKEDDEDWETDEDDESNSNCSSISEEEEHIYAYIKEFPTQMICIEKCDGTLDDLFLKDKINIDTGATALFQIIMILNTYQKAFQFTHNDLHTNNIMYVKTDIEYLYYKFENEIYRVPTHGVIYKIIDFGRSIYTYNGTLYCSDSFAKDGDANSQYNCEPYYNNKKPHIPPNYSFDLCRLGTSIYDFIIDDDEKPQDMDDLQKMICCWCKDDQGKNVLYKKNGEERYPNFKLYKMIARTVHNHKPNEQLKHSIFKQFLFSGTYDKLIDIDSIPSYA